MIKSIISTILEQKVAIKAADVEKGSKSSNKAEVSNSGRDGEILTSVNKFLKFGQKQ